MRRTVRNGLAVAGMAGGIFFLGEAVAGASPDATATGDTTSTTTASHGGDADSSNTQDVDARNDVDNDARTGDIDTSGGKPAVGVVAGNGNSTTAKSRHGDASASQEVTTVVEVAVEANGGPVSDSGNAAAGNDAAYSADAAGAVDSTTTGGSGRHGGDADSDNDQDVDARNDVDDDARTGDIDASGGKPAVGVVAGNDNSTTAAGRKGDVGADQHVDTEVAVSVEANGGPVSDSGNAAAGNDADYSADAAGAIDSATTGGGSGKHGGDADSDNDQDVDARNDVDNDARTGDIDASGGNPTIGVVAGNGNTLYCSSVKGDVVCDQNINVVITIIAEANGGAVTCSNNAAAGNAAEWVCELPEAKPTPTAPVGHQPEKPAAPDAHKPAPDAHKPSRDAHQAAPVSHKAGDQATAHQAVAGSRAGASTTTVSSAQPSGELASTGADVSVPLTVGLVALTAGAGLAVAARRRSELG